MFLVADCCMWIMNNWLHHNPTPLKGLNLFYTASILDNPYIDFLKS